MNIISALKAATLASALLVVGSCAKEGELDPSITNLAVSDPDLQRLEDAAIRGEVAGILSNPNPGDPKGAYTVFAPTNDAFARLGVRTAADLNAIQQPFLRNTLFYHVFSGTLAGSALAPGSSSAGMFTTMAIAATPTTPAVPAITPARRIIRGRDGNLYVNGSRILGVDKLASNGRVHAIDKVLLATGGNIVESAQALQNAKVFAAPELTFLVEAVIHAELAATLSGPGPFTVFAPTDQAFKDFGVAKGLTLSRPADIRLLPKQLVKDLLLGHALVGAQFTPELSAGSSVATAGGAQVTFGPFADGKLTVKGARNTKAANMVIPDVQCTNGIVHVIDQILE